MELYLNHAGTSWPKSPLVADAVRQAMEAPPSEWSDRFDQAHQSIANYFGIPECDQLLLTPGCTAALAAGIGDVFVEKGTRLLTSHWEHHALNRPLVKLESAGARVERIPIVTCDLEIKSPLDLDWLDQALSLGGVGLVAITAACNVTGELLPYEDVIRIAHQHGVMVLLDAAQVVGWIQLDLPNLGADMVAFGGHKGLQAPWGIGGLYISDRARMSCISAQCELPVSKEKKADGASRPGYCDVGSVDQFALAGLETSIKRLREADADQLLRTARQQISRIRQSLVSWDGIRLLGPLEPEEAMPTVAFEVSGHSSGAVGKRLLEQDVIVGSGFQCAPQVHQTLGTHVNGVVRVSVGLGQPDDQVDQFIPRLQSVFDALK